MEFRIVNKGISSETDNDDLFIKFIANTGLPDIKNDRLTETAVESIIKQATSHNLHLEHGKTFNDILGPIISAEKVDSGIEMTAKIRPAKKEYVLSLLNDGVNVGSSISGVPIRNEKNNNQIDNWSLLEVSLTPIPADQSTMGKTIIAKSFYDVINQFKNLNVENKGEESMSEENNTMTKENVIDLINEAFNEKQEAFVEDIVDKVTFKQDEEIAKIKEAIEALKEEIGAKKEEKKEPQQSEEENEEEQKSFDYEELIEKINLKELLDKSATDGALKALENIFGKDKSENRKLNVKYEDKDYSFKSQLDGVKNKDASSDKQGTGNVEDKCFSPEEIAKMM